MKITDWAVYIEDCKTNSIKEDGEFVSFQDEDGAKIMLAPEIVCKLKTVAENLLGITLGGIENLELDLRTLNALKRNGIKTVAQLCSLYRIDLLCMIGIGINSRNKIHTALAKHNLKLKS